MWVTGQDSVIPKPSTMTAPVFFSNSLITSTGSGALPEKQPLMEVRSAFAISGCSSMPMYIVGTSGAKVGLNLLMASNN